MAIDAELLKQSERYLLEFVGPRAAILDQNPQALRDALHGLGELNLLALRGPTESRRKSVDELTFCTFQEQVARYSGALAFLQTQHQSAASMLANSSNQRLREVYLPYLSAGKILLGIGFSQLRRPGDPAVIAMPMDDGSYQISGEVPWITGYGCFEEFIVAAVLPDKRILFGLMPLESAIQTHGGEIKLSHPMPLAAMASTNTVKARIVDWIIPETYIVSIKPADWHQKRDQSKVLNHSFFALGCAQAGLDVLGAGQSDSLPFIPPILKSLAAELETCRTAIYKAQQTSDNPEIDRLQLRAWAIDLAVRCAHAAVTASRGAANHLNHPAQRIYREALAFSVFGQTTAVMEATLKQLVKSNGAQRPQKKSKAEKGKGKSP
ncbi:MAG: acyl-CoA dehydrogenase family protein [Leptolyngbyaceae cyanobacterium MO_188.B28]|nr:acyl-CoA dehydrogenase family protein [Leptolyngbyaceae cyanobacterium MO_188.B28]